MQKVIAIGNLGSNPDIKNFDGGKVANVSIACTEKWKDKQGNRQEKTEWIKLVMWSHLANLAENYMHKGDKIYIEGKLQTRKWTNRDGVDVYTTEVVVREVEFLTQKGSQSNATQTHTPAYEKTSTGEDVPF